VERLGSWINQPIRIEKVNLGQKTRYRLLVTDGAYQSQINEFNKLGIKPWKTRSRASDFDIPIVAGQLAVKSSYVLVLADFHHEAQAERIAENLRKQTKEPIDVVDAPVNNSDYYRIVNRPYDNEDSVVRDQFVLMGMDDTWWLTLPARDLVDYVDKHEVVASTLSKPYQSEASNIISVVEASINSVPTGTVLRAPKAHESYVEYCVNKAKPAERKQYCGDGRFISQSEHRIESMGESVLFKFCATEANGNERRQYCNNENLSSDTE
jgi:hypothetical protein